MTRRKRAQAPEQPQQKESPFATWGALYDGMDRLSSRLLRIEVYIGAQVLAIGWWVTGKPSPARVQDALVQLVTSAV